MFINRAFEIEFKSKIEKKILIWIRIQNEIFEEIRIEKLIIKEYEFKLFFKRNLIRNGILDPQSIYNFLLILCL